MQSNQSKVQKLSRPANGFLGFCHVHRTLVSRNNKNIENRQVTKLLGSWWATLTNDQKAPYENRAREFKESFLAANPGFKWYTPRESTGNTPVTRQSNRRGRKLESGASASGRAITPGKLADESQMGGLSSLMSQIVEPPKKRVYEASCIANEHDYLKTPIHNNNNNNNNYTGEQLPCQDKSCRIFKSKNGGDAKVYVTKDGLCDARVDVTKKGLGDARVDVTKEGDSQLGKKVENATNGIEVGLSCSVQAATDTSSSSARKRKTTVPKKNGAVNRPIDLSFKEFMRQCPVYEYTDFIKKKNEVKQNARKTLAKRRRRLAQSKRRPATSVATTDGEGGGLRSRRTGRSARSPLKANADEGGGVIVDHSTSRHQEHGSSAVPTSSHQAHRLSPQASPPLGGFDLLLTAAEMVDGGS